MIKVRLMKLDEPNANGRIYTTEVVEHAIAAAKLPLLGVTDMPIDGQLDLSKTSHQITELSIEDGYLVGVVVPLGTPNGAILKASKLEFDYRTFGHGVLGDNGEVTDFTISGVAAIPKGTGA